MNEQHGHVGGASHNRFQIVTVGVGITGRMRGKIRRTGADG